MDFREIIIFQKGRSVLFISLLFGFPKINAMVNKNAKNYELAHGMATTLKPTGYDGKFLFNTDTVPRYSNQEKSKDWEPLFDGKNTDKWRSVNSDSFPSHGWAIENGTLFVENHSKGEDIITREEYNNFELVFDFKLTYAANSGIKYFVGNIKNNNTGEMGWNGPEYQIIDDYNYPELKNHKHEKSSTAALYLIYAPKNKKLLPAGQWNNGKIIVKANHVEHWLNGVKVVNYERGTKDFRRRMATTKFKDYDNYGELTGGHIMLTDHDGDKVYFRNIKIKRLK